MRAVNNLCLAHKVCTSGRRQPARRWRHASLTGGGAVAEAAARPDKRQADELFAKSNDLFGVASNKLSPRGGSQS